MNLIVDLGATKESRTFLQVLHLQLELVETLLRREPEARKWISSCMEELLTKASVIIEDLEQFRAQPWYGMWLHETDIEKAMAELSSNLQMVSVWFQMFNPSNPYPIRAPGLLGDIANGKSDYPVHHRRTQKSVEACIKVEENLDRFWKEVDSRLEKNMGKTCSEMLQHLFSDGTLQRTAPWQPSAKTAPVKANRPPVESDYIPIPTVLHDPSKEVTGNFKKLDIKTNTKVKTKGVSLPLKPPEGKQRVSTTVQMAPQQQQLYHVDKSTHRVMQILFHDANEGELPGKIAWDFVVKALTKLGFAAEKLYGSAWQFSPRAIDLPHGIQFHEPHPDGEVSVVLGRRYGRKLNRAFGWDGGMFKRKSISSGWTISVGDTGDEEWRRFVCCRRLSRVVDY